MKGLRQCSFQEHEEHAQIQPSNMKSKLDHIRSNKGHLHIRNYEESIILHPFTLIIKEYI